MGDIVYLCGGGFYNFDHPTTSRFAINELVTACAHLHRFNGNAGPASNLYHMLLVEKILESKGASPEIRFAGLVHDLHEAITGDVPRALKQSVPEYVYAERQVMIQVMVKIVNDNGLTLRNGIAIPDHWSCQEVRWADEVSAFTEGRDFLFADISQWSRSPEFLTEPLKDRLPIPPTPIQQVVEYGNKFNWLVGVIRGEIKLEPKKEVDPED